MDAYQDFYKISNTIQGVISALEYNWSGKAANDNIGMSLENSVKRRFVPYVNAVARISKSKTWHLYEPNHVGETRYRLFDLKRTKSVGNVFEFAVSFRPSGMIVPLTELQKTPGPTGKTVKARHRFVSKAIVLEYGLPVTIKPKHGQYLVFEPRPGFLLFMGPKDGVAPVIHINNSNRRTVGMLHATVFEWSHGPGAVAANGALEAYANRTIRAARKTVTSTVGIKSISKSAAESMAIGYARTVGPVDV